MTQTQLRWQQRFANYQHTLQQLSQAVATYDETAPDIIKEGVLQRFKFTHELAWKTLKDYLEYEGHQNITGSRTAVRLAFSLGLLEDGQIWMDMIESRNRTVHAYDATILIAEFTRIRASYTASFQQLENTLATRCHD